MNEILDPIRKPDWLAFAYTSFSQSATLRYSTVKDFATGEQTKVPREQLAQVLNIRSHS
jgi:hypothetical protein